MKTVRIVRGNYGWHPGGGRGVRVIARGETVDLPDDEADRLIAIEIGVPETPAVEKAEPTPAPDTELVENDGVVIPVKRKRK